MAKVGADPSTLFRSLRPDNENYQAGAASAAHEAEQRWPLFKAVSPRKQEPTPVLSAQERMLWSNQDRPTTQARRPALSVPGVGNKLAMSLTKMGGRKASADVVRPPLRAERESPPQEAPRSVQQFVAEPPSVSRGLLFSKAPAAQTDDTTEQSTAVRSDDSLVNLFSRLERKERVEEKPAGKRPSFLGRLGIR
jgi:hypothetical protein